MANTQEETPLAIVDDHYLVREGFVRMVDRMPGYRLAFAADDGVDYIAKCKEHGAPPLVLVDLSMPIMDGFQLVAWVREHQPRTRALVLSLPTSRWCAGNEGRDGGTWREGGRKEDARSHISIRFAGAWLFAACASALGALPRRTHCF